jgi:antitoxin Phd
MTWNVANAKNRLSEVLDRAEREGPQTIRRRGHSFVLMPAEKFEQLTGRRPSFRDWLLKGPRFDAVELPDRSRSAMRDVSL